MALNDNDVIQIFLPIINEGLIARGVTGITVVQSAQPTQQGIETGGAVYFQQTNKKRYGFPQVESSWDEIEQSEILTTIQQLEVTYQARALVIQNPANLTSLTASDVLNYVADILQSESTIVTLNDSEIGILRIMDLSNLYFVDDKGRYEAAPVLTFILTYSQSRIENIDSTRIIQPGFYRV